VDLRSATAEIVASFFNKAPWWLISLELHVILLLAVGFIYMERVFTLEEEIVAEVGIGGARPNVLHFEPPAPEEFKGAGLVDAVFNLPLVDDRKDNEEDEIADASVELQLTIANQFHQFQSEWTFHVELTSTRIFSLVSGINGGLVCYDYMGIGNNHDGGDCLASVQLISDEKPGLRFNVWAHWRFGGNRLGWGEIDTVTEIPVNSEQTIQLSPEVSILPRWIKPVTKRR
jgi:hypothetical protein